jgi:hypothetical protein
MGHRLFTAIRLAKDISTPRITLYIAATRMRNSSGSMKLTFTKSGRDSEFDKTCRIRKCCIYDPVPIDYFGEYENREYNDDHGSNDNQIGFFHPAKVTIRS